MATALAETIKSNFLKCGVCLETFCDPRALPCQHGFCRECLEQCVASSGDKRTLACPTCRKEVKISKDKVQDLPVHFMASSLKDTVDMERKGNIQGTSCSNCNVPGNKAKVRCLDCEENMCEECYASHSKLKAMRSHRIVAMEEILSGKVKVSTEAEKCRKHDQPFKFYCKTKKKSVCLECIVLQECCTDRDHITVEKAAEGQSEELNGLLKKTTDTLKKYEEAVKATEMIEKELEVHAQVAKYSLAKVEQEYISLVKKTVKRFEDQIDQIKVERKKELEKTKRTLEPIMKEIQTANEDTARVIKSGSKLEVIAKHNALSAQLQKLSRSKPASAQKSLGFVKFEPAIPVIPPIGKVVKDGSAEEKWKLNGQFSTGEFNKLCGLDVTQEGNVILCSWEKGLKVFSRDGQVKCTVYISPGVVDTCITSDNTYAFVPIGKKQIKFNDHKGNDLSTTPINSVNNASSAANSLAVDPSGKIVVGQVDNTISIHNADGSPFSKFATQSMPFRLAVTSNGEIVSSFCDAENKGGESVELMDYSGNNLRVIQPPPEVTVWEPGFVCCGQGEIFVSNEGRGKPNGVYRFTSEGDYLGCVTTEVINPTGIALSRDGMELFVADYGDDHVKIFKRP